MHISVMKNEVINTLRIKEGSIYIDATFGQGGHTRAILEKGGIVLAIDKDPSTEIYAKELKNKFGERFIWHNDSFLNIKNIWQQYCAPCKADGILFDFGFSSNQIQAAERGFSFLRNGPLDMRYNRSQKLNAKEWINKESKEKMIQIFYEYGQESQAPKIAAAIEKARKIKNIETTQELVRIVESVAFLKNKNSATKIFQAIRIHINNELEEIKNALADSFSILRHYGTMATISFHSLEDKIVKNFFQEKADIGVNFLLCPTKEEIINNKRARSAKLRYFIKREE